MKLYTTLMTAYGVSAGIDYKFGGTVANTMDAHRIIQHFQEEKGAEAANKIINCRCGKLTSVDAKTVQHCTRSTLRTRSILLRTKLC